MDDDGARLACYDAHNPPHKRAVARRGSTPQAPGANAPGVAVDNSAAADKSAHADNSAPIDKAAYADNSVPVDKHADNLAPADNPAHADNPASAKNAPPPAANAPAAAASRPEASDFGLPRERRESTEPEVAEPSELTAYVASVSKKLTGELLLKLDNGQSWVQAQRKAGVFIKAGARVTIARGAFGSYLLSSDSGATMRVRRLE